MATITLSMPEEFEEAKRKFPQINWNQIIRQIILDRLEKLKKFERLQERGRI